MIVICDKTILPKLEQKITDTSEVKWIDINSVFSKEVSVIQLEEYLKLIIQYYEDKLWWIIYPQLKYGLIDEKMTKDELKLYGFEYFMNNILPENIKDWNKLEWNNYLSKKKIIFKS